MPPSTLYQMPDEYVQQVVHWYIAQALDKMHHLGVIGHYTLLVEDDAQVAIKYKINPKFGLIPFIGKATLLDETDWPEKLKAQLEKLHANGIAAAERMRQAEKDYHEKLQYEKLKRKFEPEVQESDAPEKLRVD